MVSKSTIVSVFPWFVLTQNGFYGYMIYNDSFYVMKSWRCILLFFAEKWLTFKHLYEQGHRTIVSVN